MTEETSALGRNDPCHCGSGRKYKQCCLDKDEAKARVAREKAAAAKTDAETGEARGAEATRSLPPPAKHKTRQPWKGGTQNARGFQKLTTPRRSGGS